MKKAAKKAKGSEEIDTVLQIIIGKKNVEVKTNKPDINLLDVCDAIVSLAKLVD